MPNDKRIVYGVGCAWWDGIDKAGLSPQGFPCCPHCGSLLMEHPDEKSWFEGVDAYDAENPGYRKMLEWMRGKCFKSFENAQKAYKEAHP